MIPRSQINNYEIENSDRAVCMLNWLQAPSPDLAHSWEGNKDKPITTPVPTGPTHSHDGEGKMQGFFP